MESRRSAKSESEPKMLRVAQVAQMLGVSRDAIYRAVHKNQLDPATGLPHRVVLGQIRIPESAVKRELGLDS